MLFYGNLWARRHGTKYNGAPYIIQRAGEAVYSEEGKADFKAALTVRSAAGNRLGTFYVTGHGVNSSLLHLLNPLQGRQGILIRTKGRKPEISLSAWAETGSSF